MACSVGSVGGMEPSSVRVTRIKTGSGPLTSPLYHRGHFLAARAWGLRGAAAVSAAAAAAASSWEAAPVLLQLGPLGGSGGRFLSRASRVGRGAVAPRRPAGGVPLTSRFCCCSDCRRREQPVSRRPLPQCAQLLTLQAAPSRSLPVARCFDDALAGRVGGTESVT